MTPNEQFVCQAVRPQLLTAMLDLPVTVWEKAARPLNALLSFCRCAGHLAQQFVTGNLVSHLSALHWRGILASTRFEREGAFSILSQECR